MAYTPPVYKKTTYPFQTGYVKRDREGAGGSEKVRHLELQAQGLEDEYGNRISQAELTKQQSVPVRTTTDQYGNVRVVQGFTRSTSQAYAQGQSAGSRVSGRVDKSFRPAEGAAKIGVVAAGREETGFGKLAQRRQSELLAKAGAEAGTAHYVQYRGTYQRTTGSFGVQTYGVSRPKQERLSPYKQVQEYPFGIEKQRAPISQAEYERYINRYGPMTPQPPQPKPSFGNLWLADEKVSSFLKTKELAGVIKRKSQYFITDIKARTGYETYLKADPTKLPKEARLVRAGVITGVGSAEIATGYTAGFVGGIYEKPVTAGGSFGIAAAGTVIISSVKYGGVLVAGALPVVAKAAPVLKGAAKVTSFGLYSAYGASKILEISREPNQFEKAYRAGVITSTEILPFYAGVKYGQRLAYPIEYRTSFEKGIQALPRSRQAGVRAEFKALRSQSTLITQGQLRGRNIKNLDFGAIEGSSPKANKITRAFLKANANRVVVGGSLAQRTQLRSTKGIRAAGDIDAYTEWTGASKALAKQLRAGGVSARTRGSKVYVTGSQGSKKYIEFNPLKFQESGKISLFSNIAKTRNPLSQNLPYSSDIVRTPEGIRVTSLRVQSLRKLYGGFEVGVDTLGRARMSRYSKDIPDYRSILEASKPYAQAQTTGFGQMLASKSGQVSLGLNTPLGSSNLGAGKPASIGGGYSSGGYSSYTSFKAFGSAPYPYSSFTRSKSAPYPVSRRETSFYPALTPPSRDSYPIAPLGPPTTITTRIRPPRGFGYAPNRVTGSTYPGFVPPITTAPPPSITTTTGRKITTREFAPQIIPKGKKGGKETTRDFVIPLVPFKPKYFASVEATFFNIKGVKPSARQIATGLNLRPITR